MGGMHIDPKELPLSMQEQVGVKIVAQLAQAVPVAGQSEKRTAQKVTVRRLRFPSTQALARYYALKGIARDGDITRPEPMTSEGNVIAIQYRIRRSVRFYPRVGNFIRTPDGSIREIFREYWR